MTGSKTCSMLAMCWMEGSLHGEMRYRNKVPVLGYGMFFVSFQLGRKIQTWRHYFPDTLYGLGIYCTFSQCNFFLWTEILFCIFHVLCVLVFHHSMTHLWLVDGGDRLHIHIITVCLFNKQSTEGGCRAWMLGKWLTDPHCIKWTCYKMW